MDYNRPCGSSKVYGDLREQKFMKNINRIFLLGDSGLKDKELMKPLRVKMQLNQIYDLEKVKTQSENGEKIILGINFLKKNME